MYTQYPHPLFFYLHSRNRLRETSTIASTTMLRIFVVLLISKFLLEATPSYCFEHRSNSTNTTRCVRRFYNQAGHFNICKKVPCFVFISEIPFIMLDKGMISEDAVKLFPCKERMKTFPGLHGISFDIMDNLPLDEAFCVFGGPDCTFEEMMQFVATEKHHQFVIGGLMFVLPHRLTEETQRSMPLIEDKIAIIGRRDSQNPVFRAYSTILRPFQFTTWMMLFGVVLFFMVVRVAIAVYFSRPRTGHNIARHILGEHDLNQLNLRSSNNEETVGLLNRAAVGSLTLGVSAFFVIVILFYEIAVVNFIFHKKTHALQKGLSNLTPDELKQYIIIKGGGTEVIWRNFADSKNKYKNSNPPWHFCIDEEDCYDKILDDSHPAKFSMTYESVVRYELKRRKACELLTVYETRAPLYAFAAGWYYGPAVPIRTQLTIDRAILKLRLQDKIRQLMNRVIDTGMPVNCAAISADIPPGILGWLLLTVIGLFMTMVLASFIYAARIRHSESRPDSDLEIRSGSFSR